jgi:O-antigen/teichoic acid export membrane protein
LSTRQALSNARWLGVSQAGRIILQFLSIVALSHLLSPSDFGLMAMAAVITNLALLFRDLGTAAALIQKQDLTDELIDTVFCLNGAFGLLVSVCIIATAPLTSRIFHAPALMGILMMISVTFPIAAIGSSQLAILEREGHFRSIAGIEITSTAVGLVIAVICALCGLGVYSFVLQSIVTAGMSTVQIWIRSEHRPKWRWSQKEFKSIWHFSGNLTIFSLVNYFVRNGDSMLIGRFLGALSLGWYNIANRILLFPLQNVTYLSGRALLPIYSRYQNDLRMLRSLYLRTLALICTITGPIMFGLWALREPFVRVAFGPKWVPVISILAWFAPMGFLQSLAATIGTILSAIGRTNTLRTLGIVNSAALVSGFIFGLQFGMMGVVISYFWVTFLLTIISLYVTLKKVESGLFDLTRALWRQTLCAVMMAGILAVLSTLLHPLLPAFVILGILVPAGAGFYIAFLFFCSKPSLIELRKVLWRRAALVTQ